MQSGSADVGHLVVAVPDPFAPELVDILRAGVPEGWELLLGEDAAAKEDWSDADVVFAMWAPVTRSMIDRWPRLRLIQKLGSGIDRIDIEACRERGIAVARLAGINAVAVSEHVVMFILAALRRLGYSRDRLRTGEWFKEEARAYQRELMGKTVGLVGIGNVGREVAIRLRPFGAIIEYYDVTRLPPEREEALGLQFRELDDLVASADVLSLHVPLTPHTRHLLDRARIRSMRRGAIVVNCARGGLIDEDALREALADGHLGGAALDTFAEEPLTDLSIVADEHVIATPHSAGATRDNFVRVVARAVANATAYLGGDGLPAADVAFAPEALPAP